MDVIRYPRPARLRTVAILAWLAGLVFLAACAPQATYTPAPPTPTSTRTPLPSSTPVWFPATETPTPGPSFTPRPTGDFKPGVGGLVLEEDFTGQSKWHTGESASGRITLDSGRLTLAVSQEQGTLASLREGALPADAYLEISASAALCRDSDQYGLLLRANSTFNTYRLLATCTGKLRMERLRGGEIALMQEWTPSGELPKGGILPVRFGIWSQGSELRVFVNEVYQFSVRDPVYADGQVGVFARSAADTPLTVSFSALKVYRLDENAIPSPTPRPSETPGGG